jgi:ubiquinone/menaquinone biosynthesis C-methylase UbiE
MKTFEEQWRERFGRFAETYTADHSISGWSEVGLRRRLSLFERLVGRHLIPSGSVVLDLGCGAGTYVRYLSGRGHRVVGLDYSIPSLLRALAHDGKQRGRYVEGEAYNLPFAAERFDLVVSIGVLQALKHPEGAIAEMARVLRPGGLIILEFLNAFEAVAVLKSAVERLRGRSARVQTYSPYSVERWLARRGCPVLQRAALYLPPRTCPGLARVLEENHLGRVLDGLPGVPLVTAHAFFLVARKAG